MTKKLNITKSLRYFEKAKRLIPSCTQTFSKGYTQFSFGVSPLFATKGKGCYLWDLDGNKYIDYTMALGPVILGYNHPFVLDAVRKQLNKGSSFSLASEKEAELAELLSKVVPCCEMVRFGKNGSDATSGAVRAARAFTGRDMVACCGYHGWQDWYIGTTLRKAGVPKDVSRLTVPFRYNDINSLEDIFKKYPGKIACVIMEPTGVIPPENDFLEDVAKLTRRKGALLIFDECWTGFRLSMGGAQEYFDVAPDMACLGKAMGNGFSVSAVAGRREVMKIFDDIFFSFTFAGETIGLAASIATINFMLKNPVIDHIFKQGLELKNGILRIIHETGMDRYVEVRGYPVKHILEFKDKDGKEWWELKSLLQQEMHKRGILFSGIHAVSYSHTKGHIAQTLRVYEEVFRSVSDIVRENKIRMSLKGGIVQPVFRKP